MTDQPSSHTLDAAARRRLLSPFSGPVRLSLIALGVVLAYLVFCFIYFEVAEVIGTATVDRFIIAIGGFFTWQEQTGAGVRGWSQFADWPHRDIWLSMLDTLLIAFMGTLLSSLTALPLGFLAARNVTGSRILSFVTRLGLSGLRGIDYLIWALVFIRAFGLGPLAGMLAIWFTDTGSLGKLYGEAIENVEKKQIDGVTSVGSDRLSIYRYGFLPQLSPIFLSQSLYFFESNVRSAAIIGIVGAGGIGQSLNERIRANQWDQVFYLILIILLTVFVIDTISKRLRLRLIGDGREATTPGQAVA